MAKAGTTWTWLENGDVRTVTKAMPALVRHRKSGKEMFFNAAIAALQGWVDVRNDPSKCAVHSPSPALQPPLSKPLPCAVCHSWPFRGTFGHRATVGGFRSAHAHAHAHTRAHAYGAGRSSTATAPSSTLPRLPPSPTWLSSWRAATGWRSSGKREMWVAATRGHALQTCPRITSSHPPAAAWPVAAPPAHLLCDPSGPPHRQLQSDALARDLCRTSSHSRVRAVPSASSRSVSRLL